MILGTEQKKCKNGLDKSGAFQYTNKAPADVAHLVERHLAKVEVASSSLVIRSKRKTAVKTAVFFCCEEWLKFAVRGTGKGMGSFALHII